VGFFDDFILSSVGEEADRKALADLAVKYPVVRQRVEETDGRLREWETWRAGNWDQTRNKPVEVVHLESELEQARERARQLEATGGVGGDMTFEEMENQLRSKGVVYRTDVAALAEPVATQKMNQMAGGIEAFYRRSYNLPIAHYKEFGEVINSDELFDRFTKGGYTDPQAAYNDMVKDRRAEAQKKAAEEMEKKHQEDVLAAEKRGREAAAKEFAMAPGQPGMPADQTGGAPAMGHLQKSLGDRMKTTEEQRVAAGDNIPLGSGVLAREGLGWIQQQRNGGETVQ
jgi:hypothetical protein